jgi:hypothetical protein
VRTEEPTLRTSLAKKMRVGIFFGACAWAPALLLAPPPASPPSPSASASSKRASPPLDQHGGESQQISLSSLGVGIIGVILPQKISSKVVLLKYQSTNEVKAHRVGGMILEKYTIVDITENAMVLQIFQQGHLEKIIAYRDKFFTGGKGQSVSAAKAKPVGLFDSYKEDGFERNQGEIHVTEAYVQDALSPAKLSATLMHAAAEPYMQNGEIVGFRMDLIDEGSIYQKAGLSNGDIVTEINGVPLNNAAGAIKLLQSLRNAKSLSMSFLRGGVSVPLTFEVK